MLDNKRLCCFQIKNGLLNSCTYILYKEEEKFVWLIDCGDYDQIHNWLKNNNKVPLGVLLTHCHLDHIYGINKLVDDYPDVTIFISKFNGIIGLRDCRLNTSKYTPEPYAVMTNRIHELDDNETILILKDTEVRTLKTDGHSPDSMSFIVEKWFFTGDAYIPSVKVVTRLPGGNKEQAQNSLFLIQNTISEKQLIVKPGHITQEYE